MPGARVSGAGPMHPTTDVATNIGSASRQNQSANSSISSARPNALQLRGCGFDGCGAVVADFSMLGAFDGPVAGAVAFDDAGEGAGGGFRVGAAGVFLAS